MSPIPFITTVFKFLFKAIILFLLLSIFLFIFEASKLSLIYGSFNLQQALSQLFPVLKVSYPLSLFLVFWSSIINFEKKYDSYFGLYAGIFIFNIFTLMGTYIVHQVFIENRGFRDINIPNNEIIGVDNLKFYYHTKNDNILKDLVKAEIGDSLISDIAIIDEAFYNKENLTLSFAGENNAINIEILEKSFNNIYTYDAFTKKFLMDLTFFTTNLTDKIITKPFIFIIELITLSLFLLSLKIIFTFLEWRYINFILALTTFSSFFYFYRLISFNFMVVAKEHLSSIMSDLMPSLWLLLGAMFFLSVSKIIEIIQNKMKEV